MRGMNQLRQVKKSIAMKSGMVARRNNSECWNRFMDHSHQSKKIFQQFCHYASLPCGGAVTSSQDAGA